MKWRPPFKSFFQGASLLTAEIIQANTLSLTAILCFDSSLSLSICLSLEGRRGFPLYQQQKQKNSVVVAMPTFAADTMGLSGFTQKWNNLSHSLSCMHQKGHLSISWQRQHLTLTLSSLHWIVRLQSSFPPFQLLCLHALLMVRSFVTTAELYKRMHAMIANTSPSKIVHISAIGCAFFMHAILFFIKVNPSTTFRYHSAAACMWYHK